MKRIGMVTKEQLDHDKYEYKRVAVHPTRYEAKESVNDKHRFKYTKRRLWISQYKWSGFKPSCSCGWKSVKWWPSKDLAMEEHYIHARDYVELQPRLDI